MAIDPSKPSGAYHQMSAGWQMIEDIMAGPLAVRAAGPRYLPQYSAETQTEYRRRLMSAPWSAEFEDILRSLVSKPFARDVTLKEGASSKIKALMENVDLSGNSLTVFARQVFEAGVAKGCAGILVNNTGRGTARTLAEERAQRVRPYWEAIRAEDILDLRTTDVRGWPAITHLRLRCCSTTFVDYEEKSKEQVREFNRQVFRGENSEAVGLGPARWILWEKQDATDRLAAEWTAVDAGQMSPVTDIPLVMFWTGRRKGSQFVQPPLLSLADKQIELYRALSRQDEILTYSGSPMLRAKGMSPPANGEALETGPKRVLYGDFDYIQPEADVLKEVREDVTALVEDIRRLGMQPLTQRSGGVTATASSIEGARAHSAVQAWALGLKDAIEQALVYTSQWLVEEPSAEVDVHTDFMAGAPDQVSLETLNKARAGKDISRKAYVGGLIRFGVLPSDFDIAADDEELALELQGLEPEEDFDEGPEEREAA